MVLSIYTDGGAKGNPGPASIGFIAYLDNRELFRFRKDIGVSTNNIAEYTAVLTVMLRLKSQQNLQDVDKIILNSDSQLLVNQLNGNFKVKNKKIQDIIFQIRGLEMELGIPVYYKYIPREQNKLADDLVNDR